MQNKPEAEVEEMAAEVSYLLISETWAACASWAGISSGALQGVLAYLGKFSLVLRAWSVSFDLPWFQPLHVQTVIYPLPLSSF